MIGRKAQFFIISTIIITASLVSIQEIFSGYGQADTSLTFSFPEDYIFNNIKSEFKQTYEDYTCPFAERNLIEYKKLVVDHYSSKGLSLTIDYGDPSNVCNPGKQPITATMNLTSFNGQIYDRFNLP